MAPLVTHKWHKEITVHGNATDLEQGVFKQKNGLYRSGTSLPNFHAYHAAVQQPDEMSKREKTKKELRQLHDRPASGRTTALGRKVERPGTGKQAGPSGQKDREPQDRKHANK